MGLKHSQHTSSLTREAQSTAGTAFCHLIISDAPICCLQQQSALYAMRTYQHMRYVLTWLPTVRLPTVSSWPGTRPTTCSHPPYINNTPADSRHSLRSWQHRQDDYATDPEAMQTPMAYITCTATQTFYFGHRGKMVAKRTKKVGHRRSHTSLVARSGSQLCVHCPRPEPNDCAAAAVLASHRLATSYLYDSVTRWFSAELLALR
jgi:hypothetical protein